MNSTAILDFWFKELSPKSWFVKDSELDELIKTRFGELHKKANAGELWPWRENPRFALAEIILLDQFSRNIYRDKPEAFASDKLALCLAQNSIAKGQNKELSTKEKSFLYMPFMHSESLKIHDIAVTLFNEEGLEQTLDFELKHKKIIERFGRYPHRNKILGRETTEEEASFLKGPGSSF